MSAVADLKDDPAVIWDVMIKSPAGTHADLKGVDYATARAAFDGVIQTTTDDTLRAKLADCSRSFGIMGSYAGEYQVQTSAYSKRVDAGETHLCPRRGEGGPGPRLSDNDTWQKVGKDRVCSYCGSLHPDEMLARMKDKGLAVISPSDKGYKWYLADGAVNAGLGAIKYYRMHDTPELLAELKRLIDEHDNKTD